MIIYVVFKIVLSNSSSRANKTIVATVRAERPVSPSVKQRLFAVFVLAITLLYTQQQKIFHNVSLVLAAKMEVAQPRVNKIIISGNKNLSSAQLIALSSIQSGDALLLLDLQYAKKQLQSNGWVKQADIRRSINGEVKIVIRERVPQAVWQLGDELYFVDRNGDKITTISPENAHGFLLLVGKGANVGFNDIINALYDLELDADVAQLEKINGRRWDVVLHDGLQIKLPSDDLSMALRHLPEVIALHSVRRPLSYIDLRAAPNRIYIKYKSDEK